MPKHHNIKDPPTPQTDTSPNLIPIPIPNTPDDTVKAPIPIPNIPKKRVKIPSFPWLPQPFSPLPPSNAETIGHVGAAVAGVLPDDVDVELADGGGLPVEGLAGRAREGVDLGRHVAALEVVQPVVGVEDDAREDLVALVALGQRGQVREEVLEDVEGRGARDDVAALERADHEPAGAPCRRRGDGDVEQRRRLVCPAAHGGDALTWVVDVGVDVVDFHDAGDSVA